ncbi:DUF7734 family protein [Egbenema bharatensis]|uniref:DUF7734 family protein n=1 Tax=Egbenema bharatensis TaxID=3463334 RepID=UPI003A8B1B22
MSDRQSLGWRLEQYTLKRPQEVLLVTIEDQGDTDQIAIFKGFSSSLMRSTDFDPDIPVLPATAKIMTVDRLQSPYTPQSPRYIQQGLSAEEMHQLLAEVGV